MSLEIDSDRASEQSTLNSDSEDCLPASSVSKSLEEEDKSPKTPSRNSHEENKQASGSESDSDSSEVGSDSEDKEDSDIVSGESSDSEDESASEDEAFDSILNSALQNFKRKTETSELRSEEPEDDSAPLFFIDNKPAGTEKIHERDGPSPSESESSDDEFEISAANAKVKKQPTENKKRYDKLVLSSKLDPGMQLESYLTIKTGTRNRKSGAVTDIGVSELHIEEEKKDDVLKKSVIPTGVEQKHSVPTYEQSLRQQKKQRKAERSQTKGRGWYGMKAPEMTEELKNDLTVLQMRRVLDPKRFYKAPDHRVLPKYFEMGTVQESAVDFYTSRVPKKQRKKTLVDELLADQEFRSYNKRKYQEVQEAKMNKRGAYKRMKLLKKKKR